MDTETKTKTSAWTGQSWLWIKTWLWPIAASLIVSLIIVNYTIQRNAEEALDKAKKYASKLEDQLNVDLSRKWEQYRTDSLQWVKDWPESLSAAMCELGLRGLGGTGTAIQRVKTRIDRYFRTCIKENRLSIQQYEEDERLRISRILETGLIQ